MSKRNGGAVEAEPIVNPISSDSSDNGKKDSKPNPNGSVEKSSGNGKDPKDDVKSSDNSPKEGDVDSSQNGGSSAKLDSEPAVVVARSTNPNLTLEQARKILRENSEKIYLALGLVAIALIVIVVLYATDVHQVVLGSGDEDDTPAEMGPDIVVAGGGIDLDGAKAFVLPEGDPNLTPHTVVSGDILSVLASQYGTTVEDILAQNPNITDRNRIFVDQVILIPAGSSASADGSVGSTTDGAGEGNSGASGNGTTPEGNTEVEVSQKAEELPWVNLELVDGLYDQAIYEANFNDKLVVTANAFGIDINILAGVVDEMIAANSGLTPEEVIEDVLFNGRLVEIANFINAAQSQQIAFPDAKAIFVAGWLPSIVG